MKLLSTKEVAKILGVSVDMVRKWRQLGVGPPWFRLKEGGHPKYEQTQVEEWVMAQNEGQKDFERYLIDEGLMNPKQEDKS